jgi:hypothetical protein
MKFNSNPGNLRLLWMAIPSLLLLTLCGCVQVKTEPIRIEPIYIEITVNHRVQKELDDLFADIDRASGTADYVPVANLESETGE